MQTMVDQAEIHRKVASGKVEERKEAVDQLRDNFADLPDKEEAWKDLIRLTKDEDLDVQCHAADALGSAFQHIPKRKEAWRDLHRLTEDDDWGVRYGVARVLGSIFPHLPDKKEAWNDLIRLTDDKDWDAPISASHPLLKTDESGLVRISANHSMGRASIFKAIDTENEYDFKSELKNAIEFFERSSKEATFFVNPSSFCFPFYRSFYKITFEKAGAEGAVQKYLADAKSASEGSKNRELLLKAIENLANALLEAHKATDFGAMKSDLNTYRQYCDRAADLISDAAERAPGAAQVLRRGLPIIGERIREIQERAEALCRETRGTGTPYEPLGTEVNKWARDLSDRGYLRGEKDVSRIRDLLGKFCDLISEDKRDYPCKIVEGIREEREPEDNLSDVVTALSYLEPCIGSQLQNATNPTTDKLRSDGQPSQKTGHITTVFAESGSTVVVPHTETESGDVTVNTEVTKESQPDKQPDRSSKRTVIEISADIAVHVLVYTVLHHFAEDLMPVIAPILVLSALIILLLIIRNAKS